MKKNIYFKNTRLVVLEKNYNFMFVGLFVIEKRCWKKIQMFRSYGS